MVAGALDHARAGQGAGIRRVAQGLRRALVRAAEAQRGRTFLWSPIAITFGIWSYFVLEREPSLIAAAGVAALAALILWLGRRRPALLLLGLMLLGFCMAKARSDLMATPLLRATTGELSITGTVSSIEHSGRNRLTLVVEPRSITGLEMGEIPRRLRLTASAKSGRPATGTLVQFNARLAPLPSPVQPGGFDYGRRLWFEGIGGTGRVSGPITTIDASPRWTAMLDARLESLRAAMGVRIRQTLDEPVASIAEALINGERSTIPEDLNQSLIASGLFHILSISGLHMWLVAGSVFWAVRAGLALSPRLALHHPIKKWAAAAALAMGFFYMLLADSGVATQRSFIMIAVVFFAVMVDRPALSSRNLAIAAIIVLVFEPEAAIEASFQMSFLAVLGLVAFYEAWAGFQATRDRALRPERSWPVRLVRKAAVAGMLSLATTLVAGSMSSIPAVWHFGRVAPFGVIANGLALPVIGFIVMPFALMAAILMPFGLESLPLWVMGQGLDLVLRISDWVAAFPGARKVLGQPPGISAVAIAGGAAMVCLLAGAARWSGLLVTALGAGLWLTAPAPPDILIERTGANVAIRTESGELVPALPRRARFSVEKWLLVNGEEIAPAEAAKRAGWTCTAEHCVANIRGKRLLYLTGEGPAAPCGSEDIVIAAFPLRGACKQAAIRIDRFDLWRHGAHAMRITTAGIHLETARQQQGRRPWVVDPVARKTPYVSKP